MNKNGIIKIQLIRSIAHRKANHKACVHGLGLRKMHQIVEVEDTSSIRGMINKVFYMIKILGKTENAS